MPRGAYAVANKKAVPTNLYVWLLVGAAIVAGFLAWRDEYRIGHVTDGPNIQIAANGFYEDIRTFRYAHENQSAITMSAARVPPSASMLHLRVINEPRGVPSENSIARVIARIHVINAAGNELFFMDGRWSDTTQPTNLQAHQATVDLLTITIGIGQIREVDIALKFVDNDIAYGFNNDSYVVGLENPQWSMTTGDYQARVEILGPRVTWERTLRFRVGGRGERLQVLSPGAI